MDAKQLVKLRKEAEEIVAGMPAGELKIKAFEVVFSYLLFSASTSEQPSPRSSTAGTSTHDVPRSSSKKANTLSSRILVLREEGFFKELRTLSEVRQELQTHGWNYPVTTVHPILTALIRRRQLRRQLTPQGKKKVYRYSEP